MCHKTWEDMNTLISIVAPVHNEQFSLEALYAEIAKAMSTIAHLNWRLILVDDGSKDSSWETIQALANTHKNVTGLRLSKNYGKDWAIQAGIREATGDAMIVMDSDLQHPPDMLPALIAHWKSGAQIVIAKKNSRPDQSALVKFGSNLWGKWFKKLTGISVQNTTDFRLISARVRDEIVSRSNNRPFFRGDSASIGFETVTVEFTPAEREHGKSTFKLSTLFILAVRSVTSFTVKPLHFVTGLSVITLIISAILLVQTFVNWILHQSADGFTTVIGILLFLGSFQLLGIGIIGEYLGVIVENMDRKKEVIVESRVERG